MTTRGLNMRAFSPLAAVAGVAIVLWPGTGAAAVRAQSSGTAAAVATAPTPAGATYLGGAGDQRGTGIDAAGGAVYVSGNGPETQTPADQAFVARYPGAFASGAAPEWSRSFSNPNDANLYGVAATGDGVYAGGFSYSLTTDRVGGKEVKPILARLAPDGAAGGGPAGTTWLARPDVAGNDGFFSYTGVEMFNAVTAATEAGAPVVYAAGGGQPCSFGGYIVAKFNDAGALLASATDSSVGINFPSCFVPSAGGSSVSGQTVLNGNVYAGGASHWASEGDTGGRATLWKYAPDLSLVWRRKDTSGFGSFLDVASLGNELYAVGYTYTPGVANSLGYLIQKYDESGNRLWSRASGGAVDDLLTGIVAVGGRLFAVGHTRSSGAGGSDGVLLEIDPATGDTVSTTLFGGAQDDKFNGVATDGTDVFAVGESRSTAQGGNAVGQNDVVLSRYALGPTALVVDSTADGGDATPGDGTCSTAAGGCTLRAALQEANARPGADTIELAVNGTITLTSALPSVAEDVTIDGPGARNLTVGSGGSFRVFHVGAGVQLALDGVTVANGYAGPDAGFWGAGVLNDHGTLTIINSTFSANAASQGGAIFSDHGTVTVAGSTFTGNRSLGGGGAGIFNELGTLTIVNSTFFRNAASGNAGGIRNNFGTLTVTNSTIAENTSVFSGSGIQSSGGTAVVRNTIVAGNTSGGNCSGSISDGGGNLQYPGSGCPWGTADPLLDPAGLRDNGGPTDTVALVAGSPAIDAAVAANCPAEDQRGVARPQGAGCDIGAFEGMVSPPNTPPTISDIANLTTPEDAAAGPIFTVDDAETPAGSLMVTGASSNTALVPNVVIVGAGSTRAVAATPAADQFGQTTITITVTDGGGLTASDSFVLTVTPVNDPPSFTAGADQTALEDAGPRSVPGWATNISAGPANESGQSLSFIVTNDNAALFSAQPAVSAEGTLTFTSGSDAVGTAEVTVRLHDGFDSSAPATFTIMVLHDADGDAVTDPDDNCPAVANADQLNTDGDAEGDACDADDDNDGIVDAIDTQPLAFSNDFRHDPGGVAATFGTISRNGWAITAAPTGTGSEVRVGTAGASATKAVVTACGSSARVLLGAGQVTELTCGTYLNGGRLRVEAAVAPQPIVVQKLQKFCFFFGFCFTWPVNVSIPQGQVAYFGSPITADGGNTVPLAIEIIDDDGAVIVALNLVPGQGISLEEAGVTNLGPGPLAITIEGRELSLEPGQTSVPNAAPEITAPPDQTAQEGTTSALDLGSFSDAASDGPWQVQIGWGDGSAPSSFERTASGALPATDHSYADDGVYNVTVTVTDKDRGSESASFQVTVANVAPTGTFSAPASVTEGGGFELSLSNASDPSGPDTAAGFEYAFDCGDGSGFGAYGAPTSASCATSDSGPRDVAGRVRDKDGGVSEYHAAVNVQNVAPTATFAAPTSVDEGSAIALSLTGASDPSSADTAAGFEYAFDCGDGNGFGAFGSSSSASCTTSDNGARSVRGRIRDKDGGATTYDADVQVANVAPDAGPITAPVDPVAVDTTINASANFGDPGSGDTHTALWSWGDGTTSPGSVGSGSAAGSHTYTAAGVYTLTLTLSDDDGGSDQSVFQYVVVYDPEGGFVTGGGWIDSPAGAYRPDPALTGRATFGFVAKYQRGASTPAGSTEFQFRVAGLNLRSTSYDWLVISGARAQYKGLGTINGEGSYRFLLSAVDGQRSGGGGVDKFRMKIWNPATGEVVYDNQLGDAEDAVPTTALGGGSITIHG